MAAAAAVVDEQATEQLVGEGAKVRVATFDGTGRGMQCLEAAREGEVLLTCPLVECWCAATAQRSEVVSSLLRLKVKACVEEFSEVSSCGPPHKHTSPIHRSRSKTCTYTRANSFMDMVSFRKRYYRRTYWCFT